MRAPIVEMAQVTGHKTVKSKRRKGRRMMSQARAARILGTSREHLNRVLNGHRKSRRLVALYRDLMAHAAQAGDRSKPKPNNKERDHDEA